VGNRFIDYSASMYAQRVQSRPRRLVLAAACAALLGLTAPVALSSPAQAAPAAVAAQAAALDASNCVGTVTIINQWSTRLIAQVTLRNVGTTTWFGWQATVPLPSGWTIAQVWNAHVTVSGNRIIFDGNDMVPPGGTVTFGFVAVGSGSSTPIIVTCTGR